MLHIMDFAFQIREVSGGMMCDASESALALPDEEVSQPAWLVAQSVMASGFTLRATLEATA